MGTLYDWLFQWALCSWDSSMWLCTAIFYLFSLLMVLHCIQIHHYLSNLLLLNILDQFLTTWILICEHSFWWTNIHICVGYTGWTKVGLLCHCDIWVNKIIGIIITCMSFSVWTVNLLLPSSVYRRLEL